MRPWYESLHTHPGLKGLVLDSGAWERMLGFRIK